ncbi:MAG: hypothetical protein ACRD30_00220 [Bryobacteraceae bacterium]
MKIAIILTGLITGGLLAQDAPPPPPPRSMPATTLTFIAGQLLGGAPVTGEPYSAEAITKTTQTLADGTHITNQTSSTIYRDSEGRERREDTLSKLGPWTSNGTPPKIVFISDPVAKVSYTLDENTHTARKLPAPPPPPPGAGAGDVASWTRPQLTMPLPPPSGGNAVYFTSQSSSSDGKVQQLGTQTIDGVQAKGTRNTITISAGQIGNDRDLTIVDERWYSPELKVLLMSKHSDPRQGENDYSLTNISRAEPDPSLFQVPADYKIVDQQIEFIRKK